jgi:hypothetical protein
MLSVWDRYAGVSELVPDSIYYLKVVGISEQGHLNATTSNTTVAARTAIGKPSSSMTVTVFKSPIPSESLAGYMCVQWTALPADCSTGPVMADGSISGCPRGRRGNLVGYVVYVRLKTETYGGPDSRKYSTTWDINLVTVEELQKGKGYCFAVAALNTQEEGQRSTEVCAEAARTTPVAERLLL